MATRDRHAALGEAAAADFRLSVDRPIATCAVIVDTPEESAAIGILRAFADAAGWEIARVGWSSYPKLGPHSRVWFWLRLPPCADNPDVADALEAAAAALVPGADRARAHCSAFFQDDGSLVYERILDGRHCAFADPRILWADLEVGTHAGVQEDLAEALDVGRL